MLSQLFALKPLRLFLKKMRESPLFAPKPLSLSLEEMKGENRLRRILGPVALTSLGIGCIIGTGIFVLQGLAAHDKAGPALSFPSLWPASHAFSRRCATPNSPRWCRWRDRRTPTPMRRWESCSHGSSAGILCSNTPSPRLPWPTDGRTISRDFIGIFGVDA